MNSSGQLQGILGRKLYYHHEDYQATLRRALEKAQGKLTLHCVEGQFTFNVRFNNLRDEELCALVYAIELDDGWPALATDHGPEMAYALKHHFGFGKPFGLGSVAIHIDSLQVMQAEGNGPARYLHYALTPSVWKVVHPATASPLNGWKKQVVTEWGKRPRGRESLSQFRCLLRWDSRENYEYPSFQWFRGSSERNWPLRTYQAAVRSPSIPPSPLTRERGTVKAFDPRQGSGSIQRADGSEIFVHRSKVSNRQDLREGQEVEFSAGRGRGGKTEAKDVKSV